MTTAGDSTDALITDHLAVVGYQVNAMVMRVPSWVSRADLISAGHLALVRAARAYDPSIGVPFARYAALRIRGALVDELRSMDWLSRGARNKATRVANVRDELASSLGRVPTREEIAGVTGMPVAEVDAARDDAAVKVVSMDGFEGAVMDVVASHDIGPEDQVLADERLVYLRAGVASLPDRLRHVVTELFFHDTPVADLAAELGVTLSRISQLKTEALTLLRDGVNASLDPDLVAADGRGVAERRRRTYYAAVAARAAEGATAPLVAQVPTQGRRGLHAASAAEDPALSAVS